MRSRKACIVLLGVSVITGVSNALAGDLSFTYTDLGTLGGAQAAAFGMNEQGDVVGWALTAAGEHRAFVWSDGQMTNLGLLAGHEQSTARDINSAGVIVGTSAYDVQAGFGHYHGFVYENQTMSPLDDLGGVEGWADAINENGMIAGYSYDGAFREVAATWDTNGAVTDIGQHSFAERTRAYGLNDIGMVVGWEYTPLGGPNDAFVYDGTNWVIIGGFGQFQNAEAYDINNNAEAVGSMAFPSGNWHAALWTMEGAQDLGVLPGLALGELFAINNNGMAVGRSYDTGPDSRAMFYDGEVMHDLNDFAPKGFEGVLFEARDINDDGAIVGTALVDGAFRAFIMTVDSGNPADLDGDGDVDAADLAMLLGQWGPCPGCDADLNGDGVVNAADLAILLGAWG